MPPAAPTTVFLPAHAALAPGDAPDVSFVPPLVRRRLSPLQRIFFALSRAIGAEDAGWIVFATQNGEDSLTRRIVADYRADGSVSPHRFSTSVYNAAPGLWSVFARNRAPYTAIAAGPDTVECGLLELLSRPVPSPGGAVLVCAEETGGGHGVALRIGCDGGGARIEVEYIPHLSSPAIAPRDLARFLDGPIPVLRGKWLALRRAP